MLTMFRIISNYYELCITYTWLPPIVIFPWQIFRVNMTTNINTFRTLSRNRIDFYMYKYLDRFPSALRKLRHKSTFHTRIYFVNLHYYTFAISYLIYALRNNTTPLLLTTIVYVTNCYYRHVLPFHKTTSLTGFWEASECLSECFTYLWELWKLETVHDMEAWKREDEYTLGNDNLMIDEFE